jgi:hypothetical protein
MSAHRLPSHQTVRLDKGQHASPESGACVMELASMLAGEPFTDHPQAVCPVIAAFLRTYNDGVDTRRRQDLYAYASAAVGTRADKAVEVARAARLAEWSDQVCRQRPGWRRWLSVQLGIPVLGQELEEIATHTARFAVHVRKRHHRDVLALIDELIAIRSCHVPEAAPAPAEAPTA